MSIAAGTLVNIKYALFQDQGGSWRVSCVSAFEGSFENRLSLPAAWRGLRDDKVVISLIEEGCEMEVKGSQHILTPPLSSYSCQRRPASTAAFSCMRRDSLGAPRPRQESERERERE